MKPQPAPQLAEHPARTGAVALLGTFLLVAWSSASLAAGSSGIDCSRVASDLRSLDVPDTELPLEGVDHMAADGDAGLLAELDAAAESTAVAPVLLLTPRVATIMREVFGASLGPAEDDAEADDTVIVPRSSEAPLAEGGPLPAVELPSVRNDTNNQYMPRFQRQMYRTDI